MHEQLLHERRPRRKPLSVAFSLLSVLKTRAPPRQIDLQLAKQGYRLAAWLNVIFDGDTNLP